MYQKQFHRVLTLFLLLKSMITLGYCLCPTEQTDFSVNYVTNGGFETPYLGPNSWRFTTDQLDGWSSTKIQQGTGSIYNPTWGSSTQVIEMDTDMNEMYKQRLNLTGSKFLFRISHAARNGAPLTTSGLRIWWNGQVIFDLPASIDYAIHTQTFILQANEGINQLILQGAGTSEGVGMSCDDVIFYKIESFNRMEVNGSCLCSRGYYDDLIHYNCQPCASMDPQCQVCDYGGVNSTANGTTNGTLQFTCSSCGDGFFSRGGACTPCWDVDPGCQNCSQDGSECYSCAQPENYFLYASGSENRTINASIATNTSALANTTNRTSQCVLCSLTECLNCSSLYTCRQCNAFNNYFLNYTRLLCEPCTLTGCSVCANLTECQVCDFNASYYLANSTDLTCSYCDSSINMFLNGSSLGCEPCTLVGCVTCLSFYACSRCSLEYYLWSSTCLPCTLAGCIQCLDSDTCLLCDQSKEYSLNFTTGQCQSCLSCSCRAGGRLPSPAIPPINYSESECQQIQSTKELSVAISIISYVILFFAVISVKIVGLQLFGVLQLAYFNLADNQFVNLYLSPLLEWRYLNGYNIHFTSESVVPPNVMAIGYGASFLSNINIMFLVLAVEFLVSLILLAISRKVPALSKAGKFMFQQVFLTLFLFNSFNIAFSVGLHFKYASPENTQYYALSTAGAVLGILFYLIILAVLETADQGQFGQFKKKFKKDCVNQLYMLISVLYRMGLGLYMAIGNEQPSSTLLILSISLTYIMYNIINLPFCDFYQNYRANLCHITQLIILLVTNYYRSMRSNTSLEQKARIYTPAKVELGMLVICVLVSAVCLAYEIYVMVKAKIRRGKVMGDLGKIQNVSVTQMHFEQ